MLKTLIFNFIQAGRLRYLYAVNVYAPQIVAQLGRGRLLSTPGAVATEFDDGAVEVRIHDIKAAAAYLGLQWTPI